MAGPDLSDALHRHFVTLADSTPPVSCCTPSCLPACLPGGQAPGVQLSLHLAVPCTPHHSVCLLPMLSFLPRPAMRCVFDTSDEQTVPIPLFLDFRSVVKLP